VKKTFYKYLKSHECATIKICRDNETLMLKNKWTDVKHKWWNGEENIKLSRVDLMAYKKYEEEL